MFQSDKTHMKQLMTDFSNRHGAIATKQLLSVLGANVDLVTAFETEVGREIMKEATGRLYELFQKIAQLQANEEETVEYKVLVRIIERWSVKVNAYNKALRLMQSGKLDI